MPLSKQLILDAFALLPESKLQSLYDYSQNVVIPDEDLLVNVTMQQMMSKAFSLAAIHFPEWTDKSDSDFGRFLIELFALFSEKDFYYVNGFANESFVSKCQNYGDLFLRGVEYGYVGRMFTPSYLVAQVTFASGTDYTYAPGDLIITDENGVFYTNASSFTIAASGSPTTTSIPLFCGAITKIEAPYNGYRVDLVESNIGIETIMVAINGIAWSKVGMFGNSSATDKHFIVIPEEDGSCSIYFGNGTNGMEPSVDDVISISYVRSKVVQGIGATLSINKSSSAKVASAPSQVSFDLGYFPETLDELRQNILLYKNSYNTLNTVDAVRLFLNKQAGIKRSHAVVIGTYVYFRYIPSDGSIPTNYSALEALLTPILTMGFTPTGAATTFIPVGPIAVTAYYLSSANAGFVSSSIKQIISDYTNPLISADYGQDFSRNDLLHLCRQKIPALQNLVFTTVAGGSPVDITVDEGEIMQVVSTGDITVTLIPV